MKNNYNRLKTASRLKNWIACNYTTVNEINKKDLKKKDQSTTEIIRKSISPLQPSYSKYGLCIKS